MKTLIDYAKSFIGKPYIWGAEGPSGFDCSGLVQEILRSVGEDPDGDQTAQALHDHFAVHGTKISKPCPGSLIFYGKSVSAIIHIAFAIDDYRMIESGGGDSSCVDEKSAAKKKAFVRIRPYNRRKDVAAILMPEYINIKR